MLSIATGYDTRYLTGEVARGGENYYTREVGRGEPPGVWQGGGCVLLGLHGQVDDKDMRALYTHFVDPRDPLFRGTPRDWLKARRLGRPPRRYTSADELYAAALRREPDAEPERREALKRMAERRARMPVAFIDLTFGVPKSFSILHTALRAQEAHARRAGRARTAAQWARKAVLLEQAIWAGNNAALTYLQQEAGYSRAGYHGLKTPTGGSTGRWIDAHGWIIASFFQHTNRNEDMHLHIHNAVLNRVECSDGVWRTLDSRAIHRMRGAAGAIAERVMTEHAIAVLGVQPRWSPDGHTLELAGVSPQARALFSSRRRAVTQQVKGLVARFAQRHGRQPNPLELSRLSLEASKATRPAKKRIKEDHDKRLDRWEQELRTTVDQTLEQIAHTVPGRVRQPQADVFAPDQVIAAAVAHVQASKSAWTRFDLIRALNSHLPPSLGGLDAEQVSHLLEQLADIAVTPTQTSSPVVCLAPPELIPVPHELRLGNGRSVFEAPAETVYATKGQLAAEEALARATRLAVSRAAVSSSDVEAALEALRRAGTEPGADQAEAIIGLLTGNHQVAMLVGPAGTGKSFMMGMICQLWQHHTARKVIGLATAQRAAMVLEEEGFTATDNVQRWLQRQARLDLGSIAADDLAARLEPGDLVIVDEAAMTTTAHLAAIEARCAAHGARLILTGDEHQLGAVGAAGAFRLMAQTANVHTLHEVRRFQSGWERAASLRLREGDHTVLSEYDRHARIVDGATSEHAAGLAARAWLADTLAGKHCLLVVATAEQAAELSARLRATLVDLGRVAAEGVELHHEAASRTLAGVGDIVQTRRNNWRLRDPSGRPVVNRDLWQVTAKISDGGLRARRIAGHDASTRELGPEVTLPAQYVASHVTLGYALTVHSAQGTTVDTCYPIVTAAMSPNALYVAMTRGRQHSIAHVVTATVAEGAPIKPDHVPGKQPGETRRRPGQILAAIMDRRGVDLSATELERELLTAAGSLPVLGSRWSEATSLAGRHTFWQTLAQLAAEGHLPPQHHARLLQDDAAGPLLRLLRCAELAGHHPYQLLRRVIGQRELDTADSVAEVLHYRIVQRYGDTLLATGDTWAQRTPAGADPISRYARALADAMDARCALLGQLCAVDPPQWANIHLGQPPHDGPGREQWQRRVGIVAGYREQFHLDDDADPIGPCPSLGVPDARAAWFAGWRALDQPTSLAAESTMPVADLVAAVDAYARAREWAPDWVADTLRVTAHAARALFHDAHLMRAQAAIDPDPERRAGTLAEAAARLRSAHNLSARMRDLAAVDEARSAWHQHTEPLRQAAARAVAELARRGKDRAGQPTSAQPGRASHGKAGKVADAREAASFAGDIGAALASANDATERIWAERRAHLAHVRDERAVQRD